MGEPGDRIDPSPVQLDAAEDQLPELSVLYDAHWAIALNVAHGVVRDRDRAAEVVQEAFISLWQMRHQFQAERGTARALLLTLVHRRAVDVLRRTTDHSSLIPIDEDTSDLVIDLDPGPEDRSCSQDQVALVVAAVANLSPPRRQILLLVLSDRSQTEIAHTLGLPLGTVKSRMAAAKKQLRKMLADGQFDL